MQKTLFEQYDKHKINLTPNSWWKANVISSFRYRKILKIEKTNQTILVHYKDSMISSSYRLDFFLQNHVPITSFWGKLYAWLNHFTSGLFY